ncbi:MAG: hypothetical protein QXS76_00155 [Candidatus Bathyarchaeia archaeon]
MKKPLFVDEDTPPEELYAFIQNRINNPIKIGEKFVFDFSNHEPDMEALRAAVSSDHHKYFTIPFAVSAVWSYIAASLPRDLRIAPALVYSPNRKVYSIFINPFFKLPEVKYRRLRYEFEEMLRKVVRGATEGEDLGTQA